MLLSMPFLCHSLFHFLITFISTICHVFYVFLCHSLCCYIYANFCITFYTIFHAVFYANAIFYATFYATFNVFYVIFYLTFYAIFYATFSLFCSFCILLSFQHSFHIPLIHSVFWCLYFHFSNSFIYY